jgi:SAM-dependent methyltransferase
VSVNWLEEHRIMRRVGGRCDYRLDGLSDLLVRANGMSVLDLGCNRGMIGKDFADRGATLVHGCDIDEAAIFVSRSVFIDIRNVASKFEVVDLSVGAASLEVFGTQKYDTILMIATYHKLKRIMSPEALSELVKALGERTIRFFAWRGTSEKHQENEVEMKNLDRDLESCRMKRIHTSYISRELGVAAVWAKRP